MKAYILRRTENANLRLLTTASRHRDIQPILLRHPHSGPRAVSGGNAADSMKTVASSADNGWLHCGQRGDAPFLKAPPHSHDCKYGSHAAQISCCHSQGGNLGNSLYHIERMAVLPHFSQ